MGQHKKRKANSKSPVHRKR